MKQILQNLRNGEIQIAVLPGPIIRPGCLLIQTSCSLVSAGTERMLVEFSSASLVGKARQQPERVKQIIDKIRRDGLLPTLEAVFSRLDEPIPLGYCNAGRVMEVGPGVLDLQIGDRVASNGPHAEIVSVARNLFARIPEKVSDEEATFTVIGSIALQGVRLAAPTIGEHVGVIGLGLLGLITVQLLRANGCRVLGSDFLKDRLDLAAGFGAEVVDLSSGGNLAKAAEAFAGGQGLDAVLITADTKSNEPVQQAAKVSRKRGRIVLVGVTGLQLNRADFYEKELTFQVSCSYGPGRYDPQYEHKGQDYPFGFVRWTEQRNFEAVLDLMAQGKLDVKPLITERVAFTDAAKVYEGLKTSRSVGTILVYEGGEVDRSTVAVTAPLPGQRTLTVGGRPNVGIIGAGNFAKLIQLPILKATVARMSWVADLDPKAAAHAARKFGFEKSTTEYKRVLDDPDVNTVFVTVPHALHAAMVAESIRAGKHVFVEKPLSIDMKGVSLIREALANSDRHLMVGFNRRFSPHIMEMSRLLEGRTGPLCITMAVNAGYVPASSWIQDSEVGGGRIVGEGCHFIDVFRFLAGSATVSVSARCVQNSPDQVNEDKVAVIIDFEDGSVATLSYFANGHKSYPKERLQVFCDGKVLDMDNYRVLSGYGWKGFKKKKLWRQDKGHREEIIRFVKLVEKGGEPLIPYEVIEEVTLATFAALRSMRSDGERVSMVTMRNELNALGPNQS
jgi:predicted dehydrogenase/D-arabinose 1-dehydrogenase-like Zn-dependent alcohol dehydrogenase